MNRWSLSFLRLCIDSICHMYIYIYIYIHTHTYTYIHTCMHTYIHTYTYMVHIYIYIYAYTYRERERLYMCSYLLNIIRIDIRRNVQSESQLTVTQLLIMLHMTVSQSLYAQSPYQHCGFPRVRLEHNLNSKGWNSHIHRDFLGIFPESLTQAMLVGTMLVGRLGVMLHMTVSQSL